jgi:hypothetical protein
LVFALTCLVNQNRQKEDKKGEEMTKKICSWTLLIAALLFFEKPASADYKLDPDRLREEFSRAGIKTGKTVTVHGIPCLEAELPIGKSVADLCRTVPLLREEFPSRAKSTGYFNHVNFKLERGEKGEVFVTEANQLLIPLDTTIFPVIFPEKEKRFAGWKNTLVIDRKAQWGALYEGEDYIACFPAATGAPGRETPAMKGIVQGKFREYWSEKHQIAMSWVVQFSAEICLYGGLMEGPRTTGGSVRGFPEHVKEIYACVEAGKTHFEIR